ncbi:MAG: HEAT repeat domain-containing protein, partial [Chloroflexota bacterium]
YNIPSFRIEDLTAGNRRLAILGAPGSGKTTALMAIALWALREITFPEKDDPVKTRIEEEIQELTDKERKDRERKRQEMLESARAALESAIERGEVDDSQLVTSAAEAFEADELEGVEQIPPFEALTPLYIHMANLNVSAGAFGPEVDPAEPLIRALQRSVSTLTARTMPRMIYKRLDDNQTLILMDGYAELPPAERARVLAWLKAFMAEYGKNFIIMTGPEQGYGALTELDITPLFIKPWNQNEREEYVDKWAEHWPEMTATRREPGEEISGSLKKRALNDSYGLTPAELTLKLWAAFSSEEATYHIADWINFYLRSQLPGTQNYDEILPLMSITGALQTDLGFMTRTGIEVLVQQQETTGRSAVSGTALAQLDTDGDGVADEDEAAGEEDDEDFDAEDEAALQRSRLVQTLVFAGMLQRFRGGRYRYRHSILSDYLASLTLTDLPENDAASLYEIAQKPAWQRPLMFAVQHTSMDNVVRMKLMENPDILRSNVIQLARWLAYTAENTAPAWRGEILRRLGNAFVHPNQFVTNRERIAGALVSTRDPEGALSVFSVGLKDENPDVRRLSALGAGAMGVHARRLLDDVADLLGAPEQDVQLAAAHALAAMRSDMALTTMTQALLEGEERLQQAVAEEFAIMPEKGYPVLFEAATEHEEMFVRRAALFGLRRVEKDWARELIHARFLYEEEFFVRLVAQEGFLLQEAGLIGPGAPKKAAEIEWIQTWAEDRAITLSSGQRSNLTLEKTLTDADILYRALGAMALGQIGVIPAVKSLYTRLADPDPIVRESAHKALVDLQNKIGEPLPDPM